MLARMKIFAGILLLPLLSLGADTSQIQIKKFRFHQHLGLDFERLVLEFSQRGSGTPQVSVSPTQNGREASLNVSSATLVGAIPEATINDSYSRVSRYIGPISINNDNPNFGFSIRTFIKNANVSVDSFWLKNPTRLIVDVYPKGSLRAQGPDVLKNHSGPSRGLASHKPTPGNHNVICFFTAAQVQASLGFEQGKTPRSLAMSVDDSGVNYAADKNVICYPYAAQAQPKIAFEMKAGTPRLSYEPSASAPRSTNSFTAQPPPPRHEQWNTGRPLTKDEQLNRDADLALGLPGDADLEGRGLASPGLFDGADNFDKNKPPPTLGKALSPFKPGSTGRPILANPGPGGLLPPVNR